jgi:hypothetical protein
MENAIKIQLPISVSYPALEDVLKKQLIGEYIPKADDSTTEPPYAQILDIGIAKSSTGKNDVILRLQIRVLRTMMKRDHVELFIRATLGYDNSLEQLYVEKFRLESKTSSNLYNSALEVLANKVAYNQILKNTRFNLRELIAEELAKANSMLAQGFELKGAKLSGKVEGVYIKDISAESGRMAILLEMQGNLEADINDLISLLPAQ